jgi:hypothetical protein
MNIDIQLASNHHIPFLTELNQKWFKSNLLDLSSGFLSVKYSVECFEKMIANNDLYVILLESVVVGYCLVNNALISERTSQIVEQYISLKPDKSSQLIGSGYQILFDTPIQNKKLFRPVLSKMVNYFKERYEVLISTVSKHNPISINAHKCFGWNFIDTGGDYYIIEL